MDIKKTGLTYRYANDGQTIIKVEVAYNGYDNDSGSNINVTVAILSGDLSDTTFDDATPVALDKIGKSKIAGWFN